MYKSISEQPTTRALYAKQLEDEGVIPAGGGDRMVEEFQNFLEQEYDAARSYKPNKADWLEGRWANLGMADGEEARRGQTAVDMDLIREVGHAISEPPEGFNANSKILRQLKNKRKMIDEGKGVEKNKVEALKWY